jgi:DNA-binding ferritin-like protein (Dps family)
MASIGDLKGRVVITGSTGVLQKVRADMDAIANASRRMNTSFSQYAGNLYKSSSNYLNNLNRHTAQQAAVAAGAGLSIKGLIDQTKDFNESKFGYGFARITDFMKDGKLQSEQWRAEMNRVAKEAQSSAKVLGSTPSIAMKAREDVEKLGFKGNESESIFGAAMGLHLSEPRALAAGEAAKYMGAVYRAYQQQREELAAKLGVDANDPEFQRNYIRGLAAKAAVAGSESALGPSDVVEGMRQYAPQWAAMGIPYEMALAALAHGSNYGFRAPELGTAFKSMVTKVVNPTAAGLNTLNLLGLDRQKYFSAGAADPGKATNQLNTLLSGALYTGKGGQNNKKTIRQMMDTAYKDGSTTSPEFQQALTQEVMRMLPKGFEGRIAEVQQAVSNSTVTANGNVKMFDMIRDLKEKGATTGQIATMFEGRHVARYTPLFKFYEQMIALSEKIKSTEAPVLDAVVGGRKESEAGKTDQVKGSWESLLINLEQAGGLVDKFKDAIIGLNGALSGLPKEALTGVTAGALALGGIGTAAVLAGGLPLAARWAKFGARATGIPMAVGAAAGAVGGVAGWALGRTGVLPRNGIVGAPIGLGAAGGGAWAGAAANVVGRRMTLMGGMKAVALGAGRFLIPGLGIVSAAAMGYGAYEGYRATGTVGGALRGALGFGDANAAPAAGSTPSIAPSSLGQTRLMGQRPQQGPQADAGQQAGGSPDEQVAAMVSRMRATLASVDFTAEGQRMMDSLAAGIRAGAANAEAAIAETASRLRSQINAVKLNTGPAIGASP